MYDNFQSNTTLYLRDAVRAVRACKSASDERAYVATECAKIRTVFREERNDMRAIALVKLLYFHVLGYPAHVGQVESLKLIASPRYSDKRIGYLGCMMLLDELADIHVLITNSLKNDLENESLFIQSLAMCTLSSICSVEMAETLYPTIKLLARSRDPYISKKAILCASKMVKKVPNLVDVFLPLLSRLTKDATPGQLLANFELAITLCERSTEAVNYLVTNHVLEFIKKSLFNLIAHVAPADQTVKGVGNPFLQVKEIRLLKHLALHDDAAHAKVCEILTHVITNSDGKHIVECAIVYESLVTILAMNVSDDMLKLGTNAVAAFLKLSSRNARFIGMCLLSEVAKKRPSLLDRHKESIKLCVLDFDDNVKKRSIELLFFIIVKQDDGAETIEYLVKSLKSFTPDMKQFTVSFIVASMEKYAPNQDWLMKQFLFLIENAAIYLRDDTVTRFVGVIGKCSGDRLFNTILYLFKLLCTLPKQDLLIQLCSWCVGEYANVLTSKGKVTYLEIVEVLKRHYSAPGYSHVTYYNIINALIKIATQSVESSQLIVSFLKNLQSSLDAEIQQRVVEFVKIKTDYPELAKQVYDKMPPIVIDDSYTIFEEKEVAEEKNIIVDDLLQLLDEDLHLHESLAVPNSITLNAFTTRDRVAVTLQFAPRKEPLQDCRFTMVITNENTYAASEVSIKVAPTKDLSIKLSPPDGDFLGANKGKCVKQDFVVSPKDKGSHIDLTRLKLRFKLYYRMNDKTHDEIFDVSGFQ